MKQWLLAVGLCIFMGASAAGQAGSTQPPQRKEPPGTTSTGGVGERQGGKTPDQSADKRDKSSSADARFMREAAISSMAEVEHGRAATQNASAADVRQFAQRMVGDHSKANDELKDLASKKNVTLPAELDQKHRAMQEKLTKSKGAAFDQAYMAHMVSAHQQAVKLFEQEAKSGKDPDAKAWAAKTLPVLQEHLKMAQDINAKIGKGASSK